MDLAVADFTSTSLEASFILLYAISAASVAESIRLSRLVRCRPSSSLSDEAGAAF